jgi:UDP-N-acetylmuramoyl-L-alanyl-D-glutamate--2,6-diaminopimelate ligase
MRLSDVLPPEIQAPAIAHAIEVTGITSSSNAVMPGFIFAGLPGSKVDGAQFVPDAIARGALVVIVKPGNSITVADGTALIEVENPHRALAMIAAKFAGAQPKIAVAVTGTSGKTSVADFTRQIFAHLGRKAASVGTIGVVKPDGAIYGSLTTPDPVTLHKTLRNLADEGVTHLAFEASSHGLDQHRLDGVELTAAAFTNLGRDHMDYHPTVEAYLNAKLRLFTQLLQPGQTAVLNADSDVAAHVSEIATKRGLHLLSVGSKGNALQLTQVSRDGFIQILNIVAQGKAHRVRLPLVGAYQVENALVAAGLAIAAGENTDAVLEALAHLKGVPGRLEIIGEANGGLAIVDYAHKPEALAAALAACRPFVSGKLISVFGCGGDRDKGKRPIMGRISVETADVTIITDDNPRSEQPAVIRQEILAAAPGAREIGDRAQAIATAVAMMRPGDVVLVAGKGHETGQIIGDVIVPFSDHDEISRALRIASESHNIP